MSENKEQQPVRHHRWTDDMLEEFRKEFRDHIKREDAEHVQQQAMYDALFKREDESLDGQPGLIQLMRQMSTQMQGIQKWQDKQKTFVGGVIFAVTSVGFLFTEQAHKIFEVLKRL